MIIDALCQELNIPEVPLIICGLGQYFASYPLVNQALEDFARTHSTCYFVTAKELKANPDNIYFKAQSQRLLEVRYIKLSEI